MHTLVAQEVAYSHMLCIVHRGALISYITSTMSSIRPLHCSRTRTLRRGLRAAVGERVVEADCGREREQRSEHEHVQIAETVRGARVARQRCRQRRVLARGGVGEREIAHRCTRDDRMTTKFKDYRED